MVKNEDVPAVEHSASKAEIPNADYLKASQVHPDKKPNDPQPADTFQILREAYQVLTDWSKRDGCDRNGKHSVSGDSKLDPTAAFALLFGSKLFQEKVGHLVELASGIGNSENHPEGSQSVQGESQEELAKILKGFLNQYVNGDKRKKGEFLSRAKSEAERLSKDAQRGRGPTIGESQMRKLNVEEIETKHIHVCEMVLKKEVKVSEGELKSRAEALKCLGEIFQKKTTAVIKDEESPNLFKKLFDRALEPLRNTTSIVHDEPKSNSSK